MPQQLLHFYCLHGLRKPLIDTFPLQRLTKEKYKQVTKLCPSAFSYFSYNCLLHKKTFAK